MPKITFIEPDQSRKSFAVRSGMSLMEAGLCNGAAGIDGAGHYHETYERIDGRWMISTSRLTRLRVELVRAS